MTKNRKVLAYDSITSLNIKLTFTQEAFVVFEQLISDDIVDVLVHLINVSMTLENLIMIECDDEFDKL